MSDEVSALEAGRARLAAVLAGEAAQPVERKALAREIAGAGTLVIAHAGLSLARLIPRAEGAEGDRQLEMLRLSEAILRDPTVAIDSRSFEELGSAALVQAWQTFMLVDDAARARFPLSGLQAELRIVLSGLPQFGVTIDDCLRSLRRDLGSLLGPQTDTLITS